MAWGDNGYGESTVPAGLSNVIAIAAGGYQSLALVRPSPEEPGISLETRLAGNNLILSWPSSSQNFALQATTNLTDPNSWVTLTNVPAIVNSQNTVTNPISDQMRFYRLKQ